MQIREDDLTGKQIADLLREHLEHMHEITPPGSVHALYLGALRSPNITFWTAWEGNQLLGCGALKELDSTSGEVKSMRTAKAHRRRGIASKVLCQGPFGDYIARNQNQSAYSCEVVGSRSAAKLG